MVADNRFMRPIRVSPNRLGFREDRVREWIESQQRGEAA
jgi:predicted DNA-binding transcriptional regulator AlpA